ncbi:aspartate ammonia-lyase [Oceanicoccus sp. KOV_DT_Chl]|uniref:aspartate ammonia-lyase n=1 Tax=Oceanicoccus sp. KOV_DT_Chl TaxID=1904639 RepID=UPI000C7E6FE4|nr:aspartate ammonia-lyase [Oceanicoccus sp. KOV_DT_Chl]
MTTYREESDSLGSMQLPTDCLYGIQTQRAVENFSITDIPISIDPEMIRSLAMVKKACAQTNTELGTLAENKAKAIIAACDEIINDQWHQYFVVDVIQGGAGTSANMNANEVIANRALQLLGHHAGEYQHLHPNNDVNCSQSTNDVYPTALRLALYAKAQDLLANMALLKQAFSEKGSDFSHIRKIGRTQLQDAVPMTLGMEFSAFATAIGEDIIQLSHTIELLLDCNLGATAIGTGINTPVGYAPRVIERLQQVSGVKVRLAENLVEATWDTGDFVQLSGTLKRYATKISKICNDLRLLSSGPRCGFGEINLPKMQPGSSIMPGKVNPVIPEVVNQIAYDVIGKDVTVSIAAESGQLQLNAFEPVIANCLFLSLGMLNRGSRILRERCVEGITANEAECQRSVDHSLGIVTLLNPVLGYEITSTLVMEAIRDNRSVRELVLEKNFLVLEELEKILSNDGTNIEYT